MHAQLLLPEFEPPPKPVDRRAEIIAKVVARNQFREGFCGWLHDNWGIWSRFEFAARRSARKCGRLPAGTVQRLGQLQRWRCAICRAGIRKRYRLDHIEALANGGAHAPWNLQLLCPGCNLRKSAKDPIQYMQERGFLL